MLHSLYMQLHIHSKKTHSSPNTMSSIPYPQLILWFVTSPCLSLPPLLHFSPITNLSPPFPFPFTLLTKNSPAVRLSVSAVWTENSTQGMVLSVIRDMFLVHCSMRSACVVNTSTVSPAVSAIRAYVPEQIWVQEGNKGRISSDKHTFIYTI